MPLGLLTKIDKDRHGALLSFDVRSIWAIARTCGGIECRVRGHQLWRAHLSDNNWLAFRHSTSYSLSPVFTPKMLAKWLTKVHLIDSENFSYILVQEAQRTDNVTACGRGWYLDSLCENEELELSIDTTEDFERLVRFDQDFIRNSPAKHLLNASRKRRGLFEIL